MLVLQPAEVPLKLVRVVSRTFVAGFETDGVVRRTAPILHRLRGMTDEKAREFIAGRYGWKASVISDTLDQTSGGCLAVSDAPQNE